MFVLWNNMRQVYMRQSPYFMLTHHGNQALMNCKHGQNTGAKF